MHIDNASRQYVTASGEKRVSRCFLLRRSFRDKLGRPRNETLANLSALDDPIIAAVDKMLKGTTLVDVDDVFETERSVPHGDVAAAHVMAQKLGIANLLGEACKQRDIAYGLILARALRPGSKLSTASWWESEDTTLGVDLGIDSASTDDIYQAMDWLVTKQSKIEKRLAKRHLVETGIAMYDLSSSWVEGTECELAAFGHSRDGKRGKMQIEYGLLTDPDGRPVAVDVFKGNTSDPVSFKTAIRRVRDSFALKRLIMVGDRGMITNTRIDDLRKLDGMDWITALKAPQIAALARDNGPLQMSLFDTHNFAEITHPDYPRERLICCYNPSLASERARKRESLLGSTEAELEKIKVSVAKGYSKDPEKIGIRVGKVINKRKVAKHFITQITQGSFTYQRDEERIAAEAATDGIYVIRTSVEEDILDSAGAVSAYKNLKYVERDFRITKADDLNLRPIYHYLADRVRAHVLICMLAAYLTWHLREALAELTFTDQDIPYPDDPVAPAKRSKDARSKDATKRNHDSLRVRSYQDLLDHLSTLDRQRINFNGQRIEKLTVPTPVQRRVFELLGAPIPLALKL